MKLMDLYSIGPLPLRGPLPPTRGCENANSVQYPYNFPFTTLQIKALHQVKNEDKFHNIGVQVELCRDFDI